MGGATYALLPEAPQPTPHVAPAPAREPRSSPAPQPEPEPERAKPQRHRAIVNTLPEASGTANTLALGGPRLVEEAAAVRIDVLCALHRPEDARAAAARFFETWPRSPLASRVRASCMKGE